MGRPSSRTDRNRVTLTFGYTLNGNLLSITYPASTRVASTYDSLGRLTQMVDPIGTSSYAYDTAGRITSYTDNRGYAISCAYDGAGNKATISPRPISENTSHKLT